MDHEKYKQRHEIMKRATENVAKGNNIQSNIQTHRDIPSTSSAVNKIKKGATNGGFEFKPVAQTTTTSKFAFQTKFMKYMKERHLQGDDHPLTVDEALDEMNERSIPNNVTKWLVEESLPKNPKIEIINSRFRFKPLYNIKNRRELRNMLEEHFINGKGNVMLNELKECYPEAERHVNKLGDQIHKFTRSTDKEIVIGFNPTIPGFEPLVEKDRFRQIFHSVNIENLPVKKMEEFLQNHAFTIVKAAGGGPPGLGQNNTLKRPGGQKLRSKKGKIRSNAHLESLLQTYEDE